MYEIDLIQISYLSIMHQHDFRNVDAYMLLLVMVTLAWILFYLRHGDHVTIKVILKKNTVFITY